MSVTRTAVAVAALAAASLGLAACSGGDPSASPSAGATAGVPDGLDIDTSTLLSEVGWVDGADGVPSLAFEQPFELVSSATKFVADGDGEQIGEGDILQLDYVVVYGDTGEQTYSTYEVGQPESLVLSQTTVAPDLFAQLNGARVGAQVIFGSFDQNNPNPDGSLPTILMAVTVTSAQQVLDQAEGAAVEPPAGLPSVTVDAAGMPTIDFAGAEMPDDIVVQQLVAGTGNEVAVGNQVAVHYTGWLWDGETFDSSWSRGAPSSFQLTEAALIDGWVLGLEGQPVGSRMLLILPPEYGYGDADNGSIPAGSTLVFVIDILAAY